ncbi:MAG: alginate export family protein, partial [Alphaproteobacteria bacterium]
MICFLSATPFGVWADSITVPSTLEQARPSRPALPRWAEDYTFLKDESKKTDPFDSLRYIPLGESAWLQTGAEMRYRADAIDKPFFGLRGINDDSYLQQRLQLHGDLHLFDDQIRVFAQLQNTRTWGKDLFSPFDESRNEFQQAFVDWNLKFNSGYRLTTRLGRQELVYG